MLDDFVHNLERITKQQRIDIFDGRNADAPQAAVEPRPTALSPARAPGVVVSSSQQRILDSLGWLDSVGIAQAAKVQLALLAEASPKSSGYQNNLGALRTAGLIDYPTPGRVELTAAGREAMNAPDRPPTAEDLHRTLEARLPSPQWKILHSLILEYPLSVPRGALAINVQQSASSSGFQNNLGALRSLGFIDYPAPGKVVALPVMFLEGAKS